MPSRLTFKVIEASSEDDDFKALELNVQEATNKGWRSCRDAIFPQHIVLELESEAHIKKLQILSHHYMISKRFEIQVGNLVNYECDIKKIDFIPLGQVSLASHAHTTCKIRELKSVYVDAVGKFVKLSFGEAHPDDLNVYKQVSIMAVNIFGDYASDEVNSGDTKNEGIARSTDYYYPSDDLSFLMYSDREVVHIIKQLEKMRIDKIGDFDELGSLIPKLEQVGKVLLDLEMTRRMLAEFEDTKRLVVVESKIDEMRKAMHSLVQHLHVSTSLPPAITPSAVKIVGSNSGIHVVSIEPIFVTSTPKSLPAADDEIKTPAHNTTHNTAHEFDPTGTPQTSTNISSKVVNQSAYDDYNERPLPTHRKGQGRKVAEEVSDEEPTRDGGCDDTSVEELSEKDGKDATFVVETFGLECARQIFSKKWSHKLQGLDKVSKYFGECCNNSNSNDDDENNKRLLVPSSDEVSNVECPLHKVSMTDVTKAVEHVMIKVFKDNIISVFKAALLVYKDFLLKFVPAHDMPKLDLFLEHTLPSLLTRLADISSNLRTMASSLVIELSKSSAFKYKTILMVECMKVAKHNATSKMVLGVMELLFTIYLEQGLTDSGLTWDSLLSFLSECASNSCSNVRKFAKDFLSRLLLDLGVSRNEHRNDASVVRINKIKQMLSEFDSIDRKSKLEAITPRSNVKLQDNVMKISSQVEPHKLLMQDKINKQVTTEKKTTQSLQPTIKKPLKVTKENQPTLKSNVKQISNQALPTKPAIRKFSPHQRSMPSIQTSKAEPTIATKQTTSSQKSTSKQQQQRLPSKQQQQQLKAPTGRPQENKSRKRRSASFERKTPQNMIDLPIIDEDFKEVKQTPTEDEGTCVFCGKEGVPFDEKVVNHHYFNECPMLVHCSHCKTTLEVSDLSTHRMESCNERSLFKKCPRCRRAILASSYDEHVQNQCQEVRNGEQACPICGEVVKDDQNSWKDHLTRPDGCRHRS